MATRFGKKGVMFNLALPVYEAFDKHCKEIRRDMTSEVSFAIWEHIKRGLQPLPAELLEVLESVDGDAVPKQNRPARTAKRDSK